MKWDLTGCSGTGKRMRHDGAWLRMKKSGKLRADLQEGIFTILAAAARTTHEGIWPGTNRCPALAVMKSIHQLIIAKFDSLSTSGTVATELFNACDFDASSV